MRQDLDAPTLPKNAGAPKGSSSIFGSVRSARDGACRRQLALDLGLAAPGFFLLWLAVALTGCTVSGAPESASVLEAIEIENPECRLERESRIALGGLKMSMVKALVRMAGESEGAEILSNIRRVEVVTYRVASPGMCPRPASLGTFAQEMTDQGWRLAMTARGQSDASWVFTRGDDARDEIDGLYVIEIDDDELEVVRLEGRIDRLLAEALADDPRQISRILEASR